MPLERTLSGWRQHSQAQQEELGEHWRSPAIYPQGVVWGHCSKRGGDKIRVQGSSHGNNLCCSSSVAPISGFQAEGSVWRYLGTQREDSEGCWRFYASVPQVSVCWCLGRFSVQIKSLLVWHPGCSHSFELRHLKHCRGNHLHCGRVCIAVWDACTWGHTNSCVKVNWCTGFTPVTLPQDFTFMFGTQHKVLASCAFPPEG